MKKRVIASLISLFALVAVGAVGASWYVTGTTEQMSQLLELHEVEGLRRTLLIAVQAVQADLYAAHTPLARDLSAVLDDVQWMHESAEECAGCHHRPAIQEKLDENHDLMVRYESELSRYITSQGNGPRTVEMGQEAARYGQRILENSEAMSAAASRRLVEIGNDVRRRISRAKIVLGVTLGLAAALGVIVSIYLVRSITRPIQRLVSATRVIAAGDLGHRIEEQGGDPDFSELVRRFNEMSQAIRNGYERLNTVNEDLRREISERQRAEREREALQGQLLQARKMEALGTLSAGIAHEFGNFLQVIRGCNEKLGEGRSDGEPGRRELELIENATQGAADLVHQLLTFGRKEEGRRLPMDLNERVRQSMPILDRTLPKTIEVRTSLADDLPWIEADPVQIDQILLNLVLNARDAMPEGGLLRFETDLGRIGGASHDAGASRPAEWVILRVSDTGRGMDAETLQHIFDPFFTTKDVGAGTGLGLATVYGIVTGCGGHIGCDSEPGRGSVFEIRLPPSTARSTAARVGPPPSVSADAASETILIVDDDTSILEMMCDALQDRGYRTMVAETGERAVELFAQRPRDIDLVILDLGMPGMGGRACLERLLLIRSDTRIIIASGFGVGEEEKEMLGSSTSGFLAKPYGISDLMVKIREVLDARPESQDPA